MTDRDLNQLVHAYLDGSPTEDEAAALNAWVKASDANARRFVELTYIHRRLHDTLGTEKEAQGQRSEIRDRKSVAGVSERSLSPRERAGVRAIYRPALIALAAALLLTAAAFTIYLFVINPQSEIRVPKSQPPIATLIESTGDVFVNDDFANPGGDYASGDYSIESGAAQFLLTNRVTVDLTGRTMLTIDNAMTASLRLGSASFHCPPGTEGFTVRLPSGVDIVDLGTRFDVVVDSDGRSLVYVGEGRVRLDRRDGSSRVFDSGSGATLTRDALDAWAPDLVFADAFDSSADEATGLRLEDQRGALAPATWRHQLKGAGKGSLRVIDGRLAIVATPENGNVESNAVLGRSFETAGHRTLIEYKLDRDGEPRTHDFKIDLVDPSLNPAGDITVGARIYPTHVSLFINGQPQPKIDLAAPPHSVQWVLDETARTDTDAGRLTLVIDGRALVTDLPYRASTEPLRVAIGLPVGARKPTAEIRLDHFAITRDPEPAGPRTETGPRQRSQESKTEAP